MGHLPSHIFAALYEALTIPYIFNGAFILPILGCFHCTLHLPLLWSVLLHMGHLSIPFHHSIISLDSWGTYPSHSHFCSSNISHYRHTWSLTLFFWLPLNISGPFYTTSISFLCIYTESICISLNHVFLDYVSILTIMGPNHPIRSGFVGHHSFPHRNIHILYHFLF